MNLQQMDWMTAGKAVLKEYNKDDVPGLSAELAYHFVFALFPFAIFLAWKGVSLLRGKQSQAQK